MRPEHWLYTIPLRLRSLFRWAQADQELDDELRDHLERKTEEYVAKGMVREEARRQARLDLGGVEKVKEECRDARGVTLVENLFQDLRFALRILHKSPRFTATAVLTLALGIGAATAVFSIVDAVLLRPLPYKGGARLVAVWCTELGQPGTKIFAPYRDFEQFRSESHSFEELAALTWARAGEILSWRGSPHEVLAVPASTEFFSVLGVPAAQGRTFRPEDARNGCTVVLSDSFWRSELGAAPHIIGSALTLSGKPCTVAGVMPREFEFYPKQTSLWTLITANGQFTEKPFDSVVGIFGRLKPGVTVASAQKELVELHQRVVSDSPAGSWVANIAPIVRDLREEFTWMAGRNLHIALLVLLAAVGLVLAIACLNVANLLLGRSVERERELAVRAALGSGRSRLVRQLLVETAVLAFLASIAGVLIALATVQYFNSANLVELPPGNPVTVNAHVLGTAIVLATLTGLLFGLAPALRASQIDLNETLKGSGRTSTSKSHRASQYLVAGQVALSLVLLAGAGLLIESTYRLGAVPLGFRSDHLLTAEMALPPDSYAKQTKRADLYEQVIANAKTVPGVEGIALCSNLPPYNAGSSSLAISGTAPIDNLEAVNTTDISDDYFRVLGVPLLRGREFDSQDREESQPVAIVSQELVKKYFADGNAIGRQIKLGKAEDKLPWLTIIGVVGDEKRTTVYQEMGYVEPALVYLPLRQSSSTSMGLVVRAAGAFVDLGRPLQGEVASLDSNVPLYSLRTMQERYSEFLAHPRFRAKIMGIFALLTLFLAAIGIYGVLTQSVAQRRQEIGVRLALGAQSADVFVLVVGQGMKMTVVGLVPGLLMVLALTRFISAMLYGVKSTDPLSFLGVGIVLISVALVACYVPARRATKVDPMVALRYE